MSPGELVTCITLFVLIPCVYAFQIKRGLEKELAAIRKFVEAVNDTSRVRGHNFSGDISAVRKEISHLRDRTNKIEIGRK